MRNAPASAEATEAASGAHSPALAESVRLVQAQLAQAEASRRASEAASAAQLDKLAATISQGLQQQSSAHRRDNAWQAQPQGDSACTLAEVFIGLVCTLLALVLCANSSGARFALPPAN